MCSRLVSPALCLILCWFSNGIVPLVLADAPPGVWREDTFEDFIDGTFGNAGRNLYVSREGVLQRIYRYDANRDGYFDLVFCNAQNHWEKPPAYVYPAPLTDSTNTGESALRRLPIRHGCRSQRRRVR